MAFYDFRQNNSGGGFDYNEAAGISVHVIVEADSADEANRKAEEIGLYFGGEGDCPCCGDRWYEASEYDRAEVPSIYGTPLTEHEFHYGRWMTNGYEVFTHFANGVVIGSFGPEVSK